jgi:hypothetical protein
MKKALLLSSFALFGALATKAQTLPYVSIYDINYVSPTNLANCIDTNQYFGDTVRTRGIVVVDGNLSEVASGSVQGGNRPFIFLVDTADGGAPGPFKGIELMGVYVGANNQLLVPANFTQAIAGDVVEVKAFISAFNNGLQLNLLDANSFTIVGSKPTPVADTILLADLNDQNRVNQLPTGEQWQGSFVTLQNVTVTSVIPFSGNRISFDIVDGQGNRMNVSDRFLAQKLPSWTTVNPNSPQANGTFVPPVPGTFYNSLSGVIRHDANGCTGGTGRGYEIHPFKASHYNVGFAPPYISNVERDPPVPTANQSVDITCEITDFDGSVDSVAILWTDNGALQPLQFPAFAMSLKGGSTSEYEFTIPNRPDGTLVRYYIYSKDNQGNESWYPNKPVSQTQPNVNFYTVRNGGLKIYDIQYSLSTDGASPLAGQTVTVKGYVTASTKQFDLGYLYLQDLNGGAWSGIWCVGVGLSDFFREEEVQVTGTVEEYFGMTRLNVSQATKTGNRGVVAPSVVNPSDSASYANFGWEKWESVFVRYEDPTQQKLWISQEDLGFGDYAVSNSATAPVSRSARILAGRQASTAFSSLYVSPIVDTTNFNYTVLDGFMNVPPVIVKNTMNMDAVEGIMFYGFSNYRLLPRNNDDFIGFSIPLDSTNLPTSPIGIAEFETLQGVSIYPNPAQNWVTISLAANDDFTLAIYNLQGKQVAKESGRKQVIVNLSQLDNGIYIIHLVDEKGRTHYTKLVKTN